MSDIDSSRSLFCPVLSYRHGLRAASRREEDSHAGDMPSSTESDVVLPGNRLALYTRPEYMSL